MLGLVVAPVRSIQHAMGQSQVERVGFVAELRKRSSQDRLAPASRPQLLGALSPRETDILQLIAHGLSNKEIARRLDIGPETVKSHLKSVFAKLGVERRSQAVSRAQTLGLVITE